MMKTLHKTLETIFALLALTLFAACSSDSDDGSISAGYLANGATWTAYTDDNEDDPAYTLVFLFNRTVNVSRFSRYDDDNNAVYKDYTGTYTISGSTVTIYYGNDNEMELTYESGVLVLYSGSTPELTFTKS